MNNLWLVAGGGVAQSSDEDFKHGDLMRVVDGVATINITGVLSNELSGIEKLFGFGGITYGEIVDAIGAADGDSKVERIVLSVDSCPGGSYAGLVGAMNAVQGCGTPISAVVKNVAASAAYMLIAQTDSIEAANEGTLFGSVGVAIDARVDAAEVSVVNTASPKKRPDLSTEGGQSVVREELDHIYNLIEARLAEGRGVSGEHVKNKFGAGGIVIASEALKNQMIDSIKLAPAKVGKEVKVMDLRELKASHPDVFDAAVQIGVVEERDRVTAHLTAGTQTGAMETAVKAAMDGAQMTATLQTEYMLQGVKKASLQNREDDNAPPLDDGTPPVLKGDEVAAEVATAVERMLGGVS